jgi:hypothetical protein
LLSKNSRPGPVPVEVPRRGKAAVRKTRRPADDNDNRDKEKIAPFVLPASSKQPEPGASSRKKPERKRVHAEKPNPASVSVGRGLIAEIKKTMEELRAGKSVAAYQRLEALVNKASSESRSGRARTSVR